MIRSEIWEVRRPFILVETPKSAAVQDVDGNAQK